MVNNRPRHLPVVIVGSGFAGIAMSVALQRDGVEHALLERGADVGGTWRDNSYPGCRCDVPSHLYSLSFALNPDWTETYSLQPEIWDYLRRCAARFGVTERTRFGAEVTEARWDAARQRWQVETSAGPWEADVLVAGNGGLSEPAFPPIKGLDQFRGAVVHSARWTPEVPIDGRRVAVIGTGASAVQIVPEIQPRVAHLSVFQRTPAWILPHTTRPIRAWERRLFSRLPAAQRLARWAVYWMRELLVPALVKNPRWGAPLRRIALRHLKAQVPDPELRQKLTPTFSPGCKRLLLSNDFYPALGRPNVELVTEPISEVTADGIRAVGGSDRPVDTIVVATGFRVSDNPFAQRIRGRAGRSLAEVWTATGQQAYRGTTVAGFPNLFLLMGPNTGLGHTSVVHMIESQVRYAAGALRHMRRLRAAALEPRAAVQAAYNEDIQRRLSSSVWNQGGCASWYLDSRGRNTTMWPDFTWKYRLLMRRFDPASYELTPRATTPPAPARHRAERAISPDRA